MKEDSILTDHENDLTEEPEQQDTSESFAKVSVTIIIRSVFCYTFLLVIIVLHNSWYWKQAVRAWQKLSGYWKRWFCWEKLQECKLLISHWCLIAPLTERARVRALRLVLCEFFRSAAFLLMWLGFFGTPRPNQLAKIPGLCALCPCLLPLIAVQAFLSSDGHLINRKYFILWIIWIEVLIIAISFAFSKF